MGFLSLGTSAVAAYKLYSNVKAEGPNVSQEATPSPVVITQEVIEEVIDPGPSVMPTGTPRTIINNFHDSDDDRVSLEDDRDSGDDDKEVETPEPSETPKQKQTPAPAL